LKNKLFFAALFISFVSSLWAGTDAGVELQVEGGMTSPVDRVLYENYTSGYNFGAEVGYKFNSHFSILLDGEYQDMDGQNPSGNLPAYAFDTLEMAVLEKYRFSSLSNIHPFIFIGEGAVINMPTIAGASSDVHETDALLEGGLGLEFALGDQANVFIQAKESMDLTTSKFSPDKFTLYLPIQTGVNFTL
jgi:hypothetical protein